MEKSEPVRANLSQAWDGVDFLISESLAAGLSLSDSLIEALDSTGMSFALYDAQQRLVYCNRHYLRFWLPHHDRSAMMGITYSTLLDFAYNAYFLNRVILETDRKTWIRQRMEQFTRGDGTPYAIQMVDGSWEQVVNKRTSNGGTLVFRVDITALKNAEHEAQKQATSARKLSLVAERTDNGVIITDAHGHIEWVNEGFTRMTEYTSSEVLGRKPGSFLQGPASDPAVVNLMSDAVNSGLGFKVELVNYKKSGRKFWVAIEAQPIHDDHNQLMHFVAVESDITARRELEEVLRLARDRAEQASRSKSSFLANVSHELRTPMNGVVGMIDMVLRSSLKPTQRRYAEMARNSAQSLLAIINDILDFSQLETGKMPVEQADFSLSKLLAELVRGYTRQAYEKNLTLLLLLPAEFPDHVCSDPVRIRKIISQLLSNAIKFTERGGVEVRLLCHQSGNGAAEMEIQVHDTGPGISGLEQKNIFEPFIQADASTTRKYGGTGLGLSIVTRLVQDMNGRIEVQSNPGTGSTFSVHLPMTLLPENLTGTDVRKQLNCRQILVADHDSSRRTMLMNWLLAIGVVSHEASSTEQATSMLQSAFFAGQPYDAVILDAGIPDAGCLTLLKMISLMRIPTLPLTLIDADGMLESTQKAVSAYATAILIKPTVHHELFNTLSSLLGQETELKNPPQTSLPSSLEQTETAVQRVLLVEDNPVNRMVAETMLAQFGIEVHAAENGLEALELYDQWPYDMILMDLQMPVMDGLEATQLIRKQEQGSGRHTPIIALTANAMEGDRERCLHSGMDGYLSKPVTLERLGQEMTRVLHARQ
jgi:PAS domain S-box-containing protein